MSTFKNTSQKKIECGQGSDSSGYALGSGGVHSLQRCLNNAFSWPCPQPKSNHCAFMFRLPLSSRHPDSECLGFSKVWWHKRIYEVLSMTWWSEHIFCENRCWSCLFWVHWAQVCLPSDGGCLTALRFLYEVSVFGTILQGKGLTCCCRSLAQKWFWMCEHMAYMSTQFGVTRDIACKAVN